MSLSTPLFAETIVVNRVVCGEVAFDRDKLMLLEGNRVTSLTPFDSIEKIALRYGVVSTHPILQIIFAGVLLGVFFISLPYLAQALGVEGLVLVIPLFVVGIWLITTAFSRGYFLAVDCSAGYKRFPFGRKASTVAVDAFSAGLEVCCGKPIRSGQIGAPRT